MRKEYILTPSVILGTILFLVSPFLVSTATTTATRPSGKFCGSIDCMEIYICLISYNYF
jgi:hypothetical protein